MVVIEKNGVVIQVTRGAYEDIYKKQGFNLVDKGNLSKEAKNANLGQNNASEQASDNQPDSLEGNEDQKEDDFCEELLKTPIANWKKAEVKEFARIKDIDLAGTNNVNEAKERIKAFLEDEAKEEEE